MTDFFDKCKKEIKRTFKEILGRKPDNLPTVERLESNFITRMQIINDMKDKLLLFINKNDVLSIDILTKCYELLQSYKHSITDYITKVKEIFEKIRQYTKTVHLQNIFLRNTHS